MNDLENTTMEVAEYNALDQMLRVFDRDYFLKCFGDRYEDLKKDDYHGMYITMYRILKNEISNSPKFYKPLGLSIPKSPKEFEGSITLDDLCTVEAQFALIHLAIHGMFESFFRSEKPTMESWFRNYPR